MVPLSIRTSRIRIGMPSAGSGAGEGGAAAPPDALRAFAAFDSARSISLSRRRLSAGVICASAAACARRASSAAAVPFGSSTAAMLMTRSGLMMTRANGSLTVIVSMLTASGPIATLSLPSATCRKLTRSLPSALSTDLKPSIVTSPSKLMSGPGASGGSSRTLPFRPSSPALIVRSASGRTYGCRIVMRAFASDTSSCAASGSGVTVPSALNGAWPLITASIETGSGCARSRLALPTRTLSGAMANCLAGSFIRSSKSMDAFATSTLAIRTCHGLPEPVPFAAVSARPVRLR